MEDDPFVVAVTRPTRSFHMRHPATFIAELTGGVDDACWRAPPARGRAPPRALPEVGRTRGMSAATVTSGLLTLRRSGGHGSLLTLSQRMAIVRAERSGTRNLADVLLSRRRVLGLAAGAAGVVLTSWSASACQKMRCNEDDCLGTPPNPSVDVPMSATDRQSDQAAVRNGWTPHLLTQGSDDFDYDGVPDPAKWLNAPDNPCWPGHQGNGLRCGSQARVADGMLTLTGTASGVTGWVTSRWSTRYGRWEVRCRSYNTTAASGGLYHPVCIIWPTSGRWPDDGEYDFLENSSPGEAQAGAFMHYPHPDGPIQQEYLQEPAATAGAPLSEWHNVAFEWTPDHLAGWIDGEPWYTVSGGAGPNGRSDIQDMPEGQLTLQLDNFTGSGLTPAVFQFQWVRMYGLP